MVNAKGIAVGMKGCLLTWRAPPRGGEDIDVERVLAYLQLVGRYGCLLGDLFPQKLRSVIIGGGAGFAELQD